jgi:hypothetical protein
MKPVAWMSPDGKVSTTEGKLFYIPLYTAPRELSDEEIEVLWEKHCPFDLTAGIDFARAILRKAQEK